MLFDECDEICRRVASQRRLDKMRIRRKEVFGLAVEVGEIAASPARDENFLAQTVGALENGDAASALASLDRAHQARGATAENQCVEAICLVGLNGAPQRLKPGSICGAYGTTEVGPSKTVR